MALAGRSGLTVIGVEAAVEQALTGQFEVFNLQGLLLCRDGRYHGPLAVAPVSAGIRAGLAALLAQPAQEPP